MYKHYSDGRRRFLKMSALFGTAALISPAIARAEGGGADSPENGGFAASRSRTLGKGSCALEASPLGFGVMGMTYNRSQHPDKKDIRPNG